MALDKYEKEDFFLLLEQNNKLQKIIKSIYFSMGHNVDMINISSSHTLEALLEYISRQLIVENEPKESIVFSIQNRDALETFFNEVESYYGREGDYLFVFNFLGIDEVYEAEYIFMMINKERNRILEGLNAPMLLVMPKSLKSTFAYAASDFWSVTKSTVNIEYVFNQTENRESTEATNKSFLQRVGAVFKTLFSKNVNTPLDVKGLEESNDLYVVLKEIEEELKKDKNDLKLQRRYLIALINMADYFSSQYKLKDAYRYGDQALLVAQKLRHNQPDSIEAKRDLSVSLDNVAKIYLQKGEAEKALTHYQESLALAKSIEKIRPDSIEAKRDLSVSFYKISEVYKFQKEFEMAQEQLLKARALILPFKEYQYGDFNSMIDFFEKEIEEMR